MTDPVEAVRQNYEGLWGRPSRVAEFRKDDLTIEVDKWAADANPEGVALYATVGASRDPIPGWKPSHRVEFLVGLLPEQDDVASALAALALYPTRTGETLDHGHVVPADGPLWPGTEMAAFLVVRPRHQLVPPIAVGDLHVESLQAIPIFESERLLLRRQPADDMLVDWEKRSVPFWDPAREPQA